MNKWVITCNPSYYNVVGAYNSFQSINLKQSVDIQVDDIVYIYVGKPLSAIKFETKAVKVKLNATTIDDKEFVIDGSSYEAHDRYMELRLLRKFDDNLLPYHLLKEKGLDSIQGPRRVSSDLEEFIFSKIGAPVRQDDQRYFFVFQNKYYESESKGGYLWAPHYGENGRRVSHWERMGEVRRGDLIIHSYSQKIVAISIARRNAYEADRPSGLSGHYNDKGWRVDAEYIFIDNPIVASDHKQKLMDLQPAAHAPFNKLGRGNTGYLFAANRAMAEYIVNESASNQKKEASKRELLGLLKTDKDLPSESQLDQELIENIDKMLLPLVGEERVEYNPEPKEKPEPKTSSGGTVYPRDRQTSINALSRANHKCEVDEEHLSFIRRTTNQQYAEPHHLIPMSHQDSFDNSLDVEANIVALCSNCHNRIHYGADSEKLIQSLNEKRKEELERAGISIHLDDLLKMYYSF